MPGFFITFEGIEGSGKTTQIQLLHTELQKRGYAVLATREPGGTPIGDQIRRILLDARHRNMVAITELFLYAASRAQHVEEVIVPAMKNNYIVLCDRFTDATDAYQGAARKIDRTTLNSIHALSTSGLLPHLTLLLDCPVDMGLTRAISRNQHTDQRHEERFEKEQRSFHEAVRQGYLALAKIHAQRINIIDATATETTIHQNILSKVIALIS